MSSRTKKSGVPDGADSGTKESGDREARTLIEAMLRAASERRHTFVQTAKFLDVSDVYWNRLRRRPELLRRCSQPLLQRIALYVGWPLLSVYVAAGILAWSDVSAALHLREPARDALLQIIRTPLGAAIRTPLKEAAADHQMLIALLFLSVQQAEVWTLMQTR
ncbi:hypothetical protein GCM10027034_37470 [Ramlibacter solisilvae]|uniref:hypothetical protein n=1 Tax=Ramlibacter tataouinensis TaxID=94132 RepID=UPI0011AE5D51|nr:hypothetical protein [Ramlibacter tataouinensis]